MTGYDTFATMTAGAGRPSGGVSVYLRHGAPKMKIVHKDEFCLSLCCKEFSVAGFYIPPSCSIEEVLAIVGNGLASLDFTKLVLVGGDFNCRIDPAATCRRGDILLDFMTSLGLVCRNQAHEETYICQNGGSTIDLIFTNGVSSFDTTVNEVEVRKHLPVTIPVQLRGLKPVQRSRVLQRKIRMDKLRSETRSFTLASPSSTLDEADRAITTRVVNCCAVRKRWRRTAQRWFNTDCYQSRRRVLALLRESRSNLSVRFRYCEARRQYHAKLKAIRKNFELEEERHLLFNVDLRPYLYLKKRTKGYIPLVQASEVTNHFKQLFWNEEAARRTTIHVQLPLTNEQQLMETPFTRTEIRQVTCSLPANRSAGPSGCYYEHWRQAESVIGRDIQVLFNQILAEGRMPTSWHKARLSLLFKGGTRDSRSDLNLYRGIASEETLKKIFCKLLIRRMEPLLEQALPKEQFGFRRSIGALDAVHYFLSEVERTVQAKGKMYAVFIDCVKAFDRAPREMMLQSFADAGVGGQVLKVIDSFFEEDQLDIRLQHELVHVQQNVGTPQGNPLSCLAFIMLIRDFAEFVKSDLDPSWFFMQMTLL